MKSKCLILTALVLAVTSMSFAQSKTKVKANGIRSIDFFNYSYRTSVCTDTPETVKLRNGKFKVDGDNVIVHINKGEVVYGDVNKDGKEDAVIQLRCTTGTSFRSFEIQVFTFQTGRANLLAQFGMGEVSADYEKNYPDSTMCCAGGAPKIRNGHLIVEALTDGMFLNPDNTTTFNYKFSDGGFVLSGKPTKKAR
jgi:hypothetical protein